MGNFVPVSYHLVEVGNWSISCTLYLGKGNVVATNDTVAFDPLDLLVIQTAHVFLYMATKHTYFYRTDS